MSPIRGCHHPFALLLALALVARVLVPFAHCAHAEEVHEHGEAHEHQEAHAHVLSGGGVSGEHDAHDSHCLLCKTARESLRANGPAPCAGWTPVVSTASPAPSLSTPVAASIDLSSRAPRAPPVHQDLF